MAMISAARVRSQGMGPIMCPSFRLASVLSLLFVFSGVVLSQEGSSAEPTLVLNELMAQNTGSIRDSHGDYDDWIELYNYGSSAIDVAGCCLTDDPTDPTKWRIEAGDPSLTTIPAHGFLLIWADNEAQQGLLHANFKLGATGESVSLSDPQGSLLDEVTFAEQTPDVSWARFPDGSGLWQACTTPTPGRPNDAGAGGIVISEILYHPYDPASGSENLSLEWIELLNDGSEPISLAGWRITDGIDFEFPDVELRVGECLVVAADVDVFWARHPDVTNAVGGWTGSLSPTRIPSRSGSTGKTLPHSI